VTHNHGHATDTALPAEEVLEVEKTLSTGLKSVFFVYETLGAL
jgi:hypothetical protein